MNYVTTHISFSYVQLYGGLLIIKTIALLVLGYITCILDDARVFANHAKKKVIDLEDVKLAVQMTIDRAFTTPPPRDVST